VAEASVNIFVIDMERRAGARPTALRGEDDQFYTGIAPTINTTDRHKQKAGSLTGKDCR